MAKKIAVLPGDGIGPEIIDQALKVLKAVSDKYGHSIEYIHADIGAVAIDRHNDPYPEQTHEICMDADAILFGAIGHPKYDNDPNAKIRPEQGLLRMRKALGLYANLRPVKAFDALLDASPLKLEIIKGVDFMVVRELISGIYFGEPRGRSESGDEAFDTCRYNRDEILRITAKAFELAALRRKKVTLMDKANVLATSQLWREVVTAYAASHPDITLECQFIDSGAMSVITDPRRFDVILTGNLFGDIISDEASVITGSLGILPSASIGVHTSVFEPIHGSYPQAAGKNIANPLATILSAAMLVEYAFGWQEEARAIERAVDDSIVAGKVTEDIKGGSCTTVEVGDYVAQQIMSN